MEKIYIVEDIVDILNVDEETVRRWLRSGKLHGDKDSKRSGYIITEDSLKKFMTENPKYRKELYVEDIYINKIKDLEEEIKYLKEFIAKEILK